MAAIPEPLSSNPRENVQKQIFYFHQSYINLTATTHAHLPGFWFTPITGKKIWIYPGKPVNNDKSLKYKNTTIISISVLKWGSKIFWVNFKASNNAYLDIYIITNWLCFKKIFWDLWNPHFMPIFAQIWLFSFYRLSQSNLPR